MPERKGPLKALSVGVRLGAHYFTSVIGASDFYVGLGAGAGVGVLDARSDAVDAQAVVFLLGELAAGVALLAVVLAALAIIVSLIDENYLRVLELSDSGGVQAALMPFLFTAGTSAAAAVVSGVGCLAVQVAPLPWRAVILASATFLTGWSIWGTFKLARQIVTHGILSAQLLQNIGDARKKIHLRRQASG